MSLYTRMSNWALQLSRVVVVSIFITKYKVNNVSGENGIGWTYLHKEPSANLNMWNFTCCHLSSFKILSNCSRWYQSKISSSMKKFWIKEQNCRGDVQILQLLKVYNSLNIARKRGDVLIINHIGFTSQLKVYLGMYLQTTFYSAQRTKLGSAVYWQKRTCNLL